MYSVSLTQRRRPGLRALRLGLWPHLLHDDDPDDIRPIQRDSRYLRGEHARGRQVQLRAAQAAALAGYLAERQRGSFGEQTSDWRSIWEMDWERPEIRSEFGSECRAEVRAQGLAGAILASPQIVGRRGLRAGLYSRALLASPGWVRARAAILAL